MSDPSDPPYGGELEELPDWPAQGDEDWLEAELDEYADLGCVDLETQLEAELDKAFPRKAK